MELPHFAIPAKARIQRLAMRGKQQPAVYILARERNGTLYIGVTSDLIQRMWQHRTDAADGFSKRHKAHKLVYFEPHQSIADAILREKRLKKWNRAWELELVEKDNPYWRDLYPEIVR